jgi:mono/diheme cytochrome c family protein
MAGRRPAMLDWLLDHPPGRMMKAENMASRPHVSIALAAFLICTPALAEESFNKEQIAAGGEIYAVNCAPCHGARMLDPGSAFNLRKFPPDQRERFITAVTRGKNQMPPWGDFFKPDQLEALWAYVMAGER